MEAAGGFGRMEKHRQIKNKYIKNGKMLIRQSRSKSANTYDKWKYITQNLGFWRANGLVDGLMNNNMKIAI